MNCTRGSLLRTSVSLAVGFAGFAGFAVGSVFGQDPATIHSRYSAAVVKLEVVEPLSSTPHSVGTAFFVDGFGDDLLVTNYHVVADALFDGDKLLRLVKPDGSSTETVEVLAADLAHDLAVIRAVNFGEAKLILALDSIPMGTRLFSFGHPLDLKTSVVEGIHNGVVEHSISPRFHFTGSINPGMSGGPTVTPDGRVVGVNVSTAGNQLSFIIPTSLVVDLLIEAKEAATGNARSLPYRLTRRMDEFQARFFDELLAQPLPTSRIGRVEVPVGPATSFDCGASPFEPDGEQYEQVNHQCSTFDQISWPGGATTPVVHWQQVYLESKKLSRRQFFSLYSDTFNQFNFWVIPENDETGDFSCRRANVDGKEGVQLRVTFCARKHEKLKGLYDAVIRTALFGGDSDAGVVGTFRANGVTFINAVRLMRRVVEGYAWTR